MHKGMAKYDSGSVLILHPVLKLAFSCLIEVRQPSKDRYLDFTPEVGIQSSTTRSHKTLNAARMHRDIPKNDGGGRWDPREYSNILLPCLVFIMIKFSILYEL